MTETRTCDQCGKHLVTHRADARFCSETCRARWNNKHRSSPSRTDIRIAGAESGVGSRGGNVRSVDEARILQSESKELDRWRLVMEQQIFRTLVSTGYFHVDDLDPLGVPPAASEVKGTLVNSVRARGFMASTGVLRKVAHKAANARKAPIYQITAKGRNELPKMLVGVESEGAVEDGRDSTASGVALHSDEKQQLVGHRAEGRDQAVPARPQPVNATPSSVSGERQAGVASSQEPRGLDIASPAPASQDSPELSLSCSGESAARLFDDDAAPSMYDPYSEAA